MSISLRRLICASVFGLVLLSPAIALAADGDGPTQTDRLWVLASAALVFFMQAGFLCLEVGFVRPRNIVVTAMKNVVDWTVLSVIWIAVGFGFAFGHTADGLIGTDVFWADGIGAADSNGLGWTFFMFQLGFAATSATIVSGAMAERVSFTTYITITIANGLLIYPVVAHWAWGNSFFTEQSTWLTDLGFHDFAGSTVVHSVGGWISLVGIWMLGPRLGRFDAAGKPRAMGSYSIPIVALGCFILWVGWWGFNGGSTFRANDEAAAVIAKTNLAGAVAGLVAFLHARYLQKTDVEAKFLGGVLCGLVAITACSAVVSASSAAIIGLLAGLVHNLVYAAMLRFRLDDPVGAVPVHLGGGLLGTLCVGLFGRMDQLHKITGVDNTRAEQIGAQLAGMGAVAAFTVVMSLVVLKGLKATVGLRVSPQQEAEGLSLSGEAPPAASAAEDLDLDEVRKQLGG
jgi:Amt family ammonium transporter